jgi:hypothetical protein
MNTDIGSHVLWADGEDLKKARDEQVRGKEKGAISEKSHPKILTMTVFCAHCTKPERQSYSTQCCSQETHSAVRWALFLRTITTQPSWML